MVQVVAPSSFIRQPLDSVLGNVASVRILRALSVHGGALSVTRLTEETRITGNGVRDALRALEWFGVVEVVGSGRARSYRMHTDNPLTAMLAQLFAGERSRLGLILERVKEAATVPGVGAVWLFGSVAQGTDTAGSDIDLALLVDTSPGEVGGIADAVRDRLLEPSRTMAFSPSVISLTRPELRRLRDEGDPLWTGLVRDAQVIAGVSPEALMGATTDG